MAEAGFKPRFIFLKPKVGEDGENMRRVQHPRCQGERREWLTTSVPGEEEAEEAPKSAQGSGKRKTGQTQSEWFGGVGGGRSQMSVG